MEYFVIGRNGIPLVYNEKLMGLYHTDMRPFSLRFQFSDPNYDPSQVESWEYPEGVFHTWEEGSTWTKVQGVSENQWDWYYENSDWDTAFWWAFTDSDNMVQVIDGNTSDVHLMDALFDGCSSLTSVCMLDTSNVVSMNEMFMMCRSLSTVPLFDTSNVDSTRYMFGECRSLVEVPLFDLHNVSMMNYMFHGCSSLTSIPAFNTSNATRMRGLFMSCLSLTSVPILDTHNVTDIAQMFDGCRSLQTIPLFDTSNVTDMSYFADGCTSLMEVPILNTSKVENMSWAFRDCTNVYRGAYTLYNQASTQTTPPTGHTNTFKNCGSNTTSGSMDLMSIPESWGGNGIGW